MLTKPCRKGRKPSASVSGVKCGSTFGYASGNTRTARPSASSAATSRAQRSRCRGTSASENAPSPWKGKAPPDSRRVSSRSSAGQRAQPVIASMKRRMPRPFTQSRVTTMWTSRGRRAVIAAPSYRWW